MPTTKPEADTLARHIDQADPRGLTRTQIINLFGRRISSLQLDYMIRELTNTGRYQTWTEPTRGRPRIWLRRTPPISAIQTSDGWYDIVPNPYNTITFTDQHGERRSIPLADIRALVTR